MLASHPEENQRMLEAGAGLPNVGAEDDAGKTVRLRDFNGKPLVVYFYPRADTPGCTDETKQFRDLYKDFKKKGVVVVGVSRDTVKAQAKFKEKYEVPFPLLADVDSAICDAFGVIVDKINYGRKYKGIQRATFLFGKNGKIKEVWPKVKVAGHASEVLKSLSAR
jgi:thioredoxin-dependent peroxiredoxin